MDIQYLTSNWELVHVYNPSSAILKFKKLWKKLRFKKIFGSGTDEPVCRAEIETQM